MHRLLVGSLIAGGALVAIGGIVLAAFLVAQRGTSDFIQPATSQADTLPTAGPLSPPEAPGPISPPVVIADPTPTFPVAPLTPPPDDSQWNTYLSPLGFTISHPPGWALISLGASPPAVGHVRIMNETAKAAYDSRLYNGVLEGGARSGETRIEIIPDIFPTFDVEGIAASCESENASTPRVATRVTFMGHPAIRCVGAGPLAYSPEVIAEQEMYVVALPSGRVVAISAVSYDAGPASADVLRAILATIDWVVTR